MGSGVTGTGDSCHGPRAHGTTRRRANLHAQAPSRVLRHASFGSAGQALSDIQAITSNPWVKLVAVVRVRAANETEARRVLPSVLSSPGTVDIKVANENNAALGVDALVTDVDFAIEESAALFEVDGTIIKQG